MNEKLFEKYYLKTLTEEEARTLARALREDARAQTEFVRFLQERSLLVEAAGRMKKAAAASAVEQPAPAHSKRAHTRLFPYNRGSILLAAVAVAMALGLFAYFYGPTPTGQPQAVASVTDAAGNARISGHAGKPSGSASPGTALYAGDALAASDSGRFTVKLADGSTIDADANTALTLASGDKGEALTLAQGRIYCEIAKRKSGQPPLSIRTATGYRAAVLGTRFELDCGKDGCTLKVEEGRVEFSNAQKTVPVSAMELSIASAGGPPGDPLPTLTCDIATWKFQPKPAAPGTVLFQDDFEKGTGNWEFFGENIRLVDGQGIGGSRCVEVDCRDLPADDHCTLELKAPIRWKCLVEAQVKVTGSPRLNFGAVATLGSPSEPGEGCWVATVESRGGNKPRVQETIVPPNQWYSIAESISAFPENRPFLYQCASLVNRQETRGVRWTVAEASVRRIQLRFKADARYLVDNVVIKNASPDALFPARVLFHDSFKTDTGFWFAGEGQWRREAGKVAEPKLWAYVTNPRGGKSGLTLDCPLGQPILLCRFGILVPEGAGNSVNILREDMGNPGQCSDGKPISWKECLALPETTQYPELAQFVQQVEAGGEPAIARGESLDWWYLSVGRFALGFTFDRQGQPCPIRRGYHLRQFSYNPGRLAISFAGSGEFRLDNVWVVGYQSMRSLQDF